MIRSWCAASEFAANEGFDEAVALVDGGMVPVADQRQGVGAFRRLVDQVGILAPAGQRRQQQDSAHSCRHGAILQ